MAVRAVAQQAANMEIIKQHCCVPILVDSSRCWRRVALLLGQEVSNNEAAEAEWGQTHSVLRTPGVCVLQGGACSLKLNLCFPGRHFFCCVTAIHSGILMWQ